MSDQLCVFIIDDDDIYQFLTKRELEISEKVKKTKVFSDGKKAISYLSEHSHEIELLPDIIFLDLNMPIMSGWTFIERFRELNIKNKSSIKIYMVSSSFDKRDIEKSKEYAEVADYLIKPMTRSQISGIFKSEE
jgi:CheY-like chemotaxis protein